MTRPSDHHSDQWNTSGKKTASHSDTPVVKPLFKEVVPEDPYSKGSSRGRKKRLANPQDRKNLFYIVLAIVVALVILILLELKQLNDEHAERIAAPNRVEQLN